MKESTYEDKGYLLFDIPEIIPQLNALRKNIYEIFDTISIASGGEPIESDKDIIRFHAKNQPKQFLGVKQIWCSTSLFAIAGNPIFTKYLHSIGLEQPNFELPPLLRCDMPIPEQSIFEQHQDYSYNIGSGNSVTIWIPLQNTDKSEGALLVAPGTHKNGIYPNDKGIVTPEHHFDFIHCPVKFGEVLVFNQKLVHKSGFNCSDKIRFSIQLRFSDLKCSDYASRGFPINHKITTEMFAK